MSDRSPDEELDILKLEISTLPRRHYTLAARALQVAEEFKKERDALRQELLKEPG